VRGKLVSGVAVVGLLLAACSSSSNANSIRLTCAALWDMLHSNTTPVGYYINVIERSADADSGEFVPDAQDLGDAHSPGQLRDDVSDLEGDCDASGHRLRW
jgi:hypothetical protein